MYDREKLKPLSQKRKAQEERSQNSPQTGPDGPPPGGGRLAEDRPRFGKRVLITRTRRQASRLALLLADEGAVPIELPAIEIEPVADEAAVEAALDGLRAGVYGWVVFTSANAVELFFGLMREHGLDARAFVPPPARRGAGPKGAAIGPSTADALPVRGIFAAVLPDLSVADAGG